MASIVALIQSLCRQLERLKKKKKLYTPYIHIYYDFHRRKEILNQTEQQERPLASVRAETARREMRGRIFAVIGVPQTRTRSAEAVPCCVSPSAFLPRLQPRRDYKVTQCNARLLEIEIKKKTKRRDKESATSHRAKDHVFCTATTFVHRQPALRSICKAETAPEEPGRCGQFPITPEAIIIHMLMCQIAGHHFCSENAADEGEKGRFEGHESG